MRTEKDFKDLINDLNGYGVDYCITGGFSVVYYSRPRFTDDMDILVYPSLENSEKVYAALKSFGADLSDITSDYFKETGKFYQVGVPPVQIHILNSIKGVDIERVFKNKVKAVYGVEDTYFISIDDLIANKKAAGRDKDKLDAKILKEVKNKNKNGEIR